MKNVSTRVTLAVYTVSHFVVDFSCGWLLYELYKTGVIGEAYAGAAFVLYNILAFGLQFIIGSGADKLGPVAVAAAGYGLLLAGLLLPGSMWGLSVTLAGLGNAAFHAGGGVDSLIFSRGRMARSGIFVSSGAVGVALGMLTGGAGLVGRYIPVAAAVVCLILIILFGRTDEEPAYPADMIKPGKAALTSGAAATVFCLFAVLVRSYAGFLFSMPWKKGFVLVLAAAFFAACGKALGGILADALGGRLIGTVSVIVSIPLVVLGGEHIIPSLFGIMAFNMAMPVTLYTLSEQFRGHEGFAFGLTTLALLIGYLGFSFVTLSPVLSTVILIALTAAAGITIYLSVPGRVRIKQRVGK